jgi:hypothetical protein
VPGAISYFVSAYATHESLRSLGADGEIALARVDGQTTKFYQFAFKTSSGGAVSYAGPYKAFTDHHVTATSGTSVSSIFGHTPFSGKA